jgi:polysaccharide deacetylase 2 family uncharacterized protein YibQ
MANKQRPAKRRTGGKGGRYDRVVLTGIIVALAAIALALWGPPLETFLPDGGQKSSREGKKPVQQPRHEDRQAARPPDQAALVAIIIDDLGQDLEAAREIASLPYKITFAVMPGLPHSRKVAELAGQHGREVLLHLPMQSHAREGKRSPGTLTAAMTPMDFLSTLTGDLDSVPGAIGVNNHEGSSLTENREAMKFLMAELKARDLLFLDSRTSPRSVAYDTAREFGMKAAKRDVFLDNESDNREHGRAVGIGHPHPATISELRKWLASASGRGIQVVPLSKIAQ